MSRLVIAALFFLAHLVVFAAARSANAFAPGDRWGLTASGATGLDGDPITLTWSIVPDGTQLVGEGPSNLIEFLDTNFEGAPGGVEWMDLFDQVFERWSELGGLTYVHETSDDGATQGSSASGSRGVLGVRGDVRIGGAFIDGAGSTLAFNFLPDNGDMVLDTGDGEFFTNSAGAHRRLRNTMMHEAAHGFGLNHIESSSNFLMEPVISAAFDGPQFDDIRGLQWFYGDALEKTNGGQGNDVPGNATSLGSLVPGGSVSIGTDAADAVVLAGETDFISIDRITDIDYFSLTVAEPLLLDVLLTPLGPTYSQATQGGTPSPIDTSAISNLALNVYDTDGRTLLASANNAAAGFSETLADVFLPAAGEYFVRISGDDEIIQFYQLDLAVGNPLSFLTADFNEDGAVDADDYQDWEQAFGVSAGGDADVDGDSDGLDLLSWQRQLGIGGGLQAATVAVPEPSTSCLALLAFLAGGTAMGRRRLSK